MSRTITSVLSSAIGASCSGLAAVEANAVIFPRSAVGAKTWDDCVVDFVVDLNTDFIPVFVPGDLPYKFAPDGIMNDNGLLKFNKKVSFLLLENSPLTQKQVKELQNDGYVMMLKDYDGQYILLGIETGLRFLTSSQDLNSTDTHGGIMVEMQESNCNEPQVFNTEQSWIYLVADGYVFIQGLIIPDGTGTPQLAHFETNTTKSCYIGFAGATSTGGVSIVTGTYGSVTYNWIGEKTEVILCVPKETTYFACTDSLFSGSLDLSNLLYLVNVEMMNCDNINSLNTLTSKIIYATSSGLSVAGQKLISDNAYTVYLSGIVDGEIDLTGNDPFPETDISAVHSQTYVDLVQDMTSDGWTFVYST